MIIFIVHSSLTENDNNEMKSEESPELLSFLRLFRAWILQVNPLKYENLKLMK